MKPLKALRLPWLAATLLLFQLASIGCGKEAPPPERSTVRTVKAMVVGGGSLGRLTFPGTTQAADRAELSFRVAGPLVELNVNEGDPVQKGTILARIDPKDFEIALQEAQAAYDKAEADRKRHQKLYEQEAIPLSDLELRRAQRDVARARLDQAEADLSYTRMRAPYDGTIGRRLVENFERVRVQQPIVTLHNLDIIEIVIDVPEYLMNEVQHGDARVTATFDSASDKQYDLAFKEATADADAQTRTYQITLMMPQPAELRVLPGMTATVTATITGTEGLEQTTFPVPSLAIFANDEGQAQVWVVDTNTMTVHARPISVGPVTGENSVQVMSGLEAGETIVVTGTSQLNEGDKVRFMEERRRDVQG